MLVGPRIPRDRPAAVEVGYSLHISRICRFRDPVGKDCAHFRRVQALIQGRRSLRGTQRQQLHFSKVWQTRWIPWPAVIGDRSDAKTAAAGAGAFARLHTRARASRASTAPVARGPQARETRRMMSQGRAKRPELRQTQPWQPREAADSERPPKGAYYKACKPRLPLWVATATSHKAFSVQTAHGKRIPMRGAKKRPCMLAVGCRRHARTAADV